MSEMTGDLFLEGIDWQQLGVCLTMVHCPKKLSESQQKRSAVIWGVYMSCIGLILCKTYKNLVVENFFHMMYALPYP